MQSKQERQPSTPTQTPRVVIQSARSAHKQQGNISPYYRDHFLLSEYRELQQHAPNGVYVLPSPKSVLKWDGIIFVRQGDYRGGIFRFVIDIPESYPDARPSLRFVSKVFHPQIGTDGSVNMQYWFPTWTMQKDFIVHILALVHKFFHQVRTDEALNTTAAKLFTDNREEFRARAAQCVKDSIEASAYAPKDCSLRFGMFNEKHAEVRTTLLQRIDDPRAAIAAVKEWCVKAAPAPSGQSTAR